MTIEKMLGIIRRGGGSLHLDCDRYVIDFAEDFAGWEQFDTSQDAHYFGVWMHYERRLILTYCEGDWTLEESETVEEHREKVQRCIDCYDAGRVACVIGADGATDVTQDRAVFLTGEKPIGIADVLKATLG